MVWKKKNKPTQVKFKEQLSAGKAMLTAFWEHHGPILLEFAPSGSNIKQHAYFDTLCKLQQAIDIKKPGFRLEESYHLAG